MRIVIVGSGIAGLASGWHLGRAGHRVTLLERMPRLGLDAHSIEFELAGRQLESDIPPRYFSESGWPNLFSLMEDLQVDIERVDRSKSWSQLQGRCVLKTSDRNPQSSGWRTLFSSSARRIRQDVWRFVATTREELNYGSLGDISFGNWLDSKTYSRDFLDRFLLPGLSSTVCTCSYENLRRIPADWMLETVLQLLTDDRLYRATRGISDLSKRLASEITEIRLNTVVESAETDGEQIEIKLADGEVLRADHLVVATQADAALELLPRLKSDDRDMLHTFDYEDSEVVVHQDVTLMPGNRRNWSHFNFFYNQQHDAAMCTVWLNRFYSDWNRLPPVFQTIRPIVPIDEQNTICRRRISRSIANGNSQRGLELLERYHRRPNQRIWFCGSYASAGIPLLESGVLSGKRVAQWIED